MEAKGELHLDGIDGIDDDPHEQEQEQEQEQEHGGVNSVPFIYILYNPSIQATNKLSPLSTFELTQTHSHKL